MQSSLQVHRHHVTSAWGSMAVTMVWVAVAIVALIMHAPPSANAVHAGQSSETVLGIETQGTAAEGTVFAGIIR